MQVSLQAAFQKSYIRIKIIQFYSEQKRFLLDTFVATTTVECLGYLISVHERHVAASLILTISITYE